jgi:hypothetical protein
MKVFLRRLSAAFAAGAAGGLLNGITVWASGEYGLTRMAHVRLAPALTPGFLYPRVVWGGLWAFVLLLPVLERSPGWRVVVLALLPTLAQLFWFFPRTTPYGMLGLGLGTLMPLFVLLFNLVWALVAVAWYRRAA